MIPFNKPVLTGNEEKYLLESLNSGKISGDGQFTRMCQKWFTNKLNSEGALLTPSCTHALEMAAILLNIKEGDEVIMPSYTFVSTANAFLLRGAKIIFVDICPDTMNIDATKIENAITDKTKVIVPVHYAGVACEMDSIMAIASKYNLFVVEDAAQGMMSSYKGKPLGTIGDLGTFSFHETKNYTSAGEGGLLIINNKKFIDRAEIIREKGTNRSLFFRGAVDKYSWVDIGSSYLMSDISAAFLWGQLEQVNKINDDRLKSWEIYYQGLSKLQDMGLIKLPVIPNNCIHNAHMFYIKVTDFEVRTDLLKFLSKYQILAVFHYIPLHSSDFGIRNTKFNGDDKYTTIESDKIIRLPLFYNICNKDILYIISCIFNFYGIHFNED